MDFKLLQEVVSAKREFFLAGNTKDINLRIKWVKLIRDNLVLYKRPRGQEVKTSPFHGGDMGSIPVGVTKYFATLAQLARASHL